MKKLISCVILTAFCIFGGITAHAEENETEMSGGFVPVTLGGGGNTEYSDPVSPDDKPTQTERENTTPSTPEPPPLVKPVVTPDTPSEPVKPKPDPSEYSEPSETKPVKPESGKYEPTKTQTETSIPAKPLPSDTYTDDTDTDDDTSYYFEDEDYPDYSYSHRRNEPKTPSVALTPSIRGTSRKNDLNITARTDVNGNITLTWDKVKKADKYTVYLFVGTRYAKVGETSKTSYIYKGAKVGRTYKFVVRYSTGGETSSFSDSFKATVTMKAVGKPVVTAAAKGKDVTLMWNAVPDAKEYAVYRITGDKLEKVVSTQKNTAVIQRLPTDRGYAVKALVNGKWTTVTKSDIATVKA